MKLKQRVRECFDHCNYNCSESIFVAANEVYQLGFDEKTLRLYSGFGGGMGCQDSCGLLLAAVSVLGYMLVDDRARHTPSAKQHCARFVARFQEKIGATRCQDILAFHTEDSEGCIGSSQVAADLLEAYLKEHAAELVHPLP